jgi:two-component system response regulator HydG
MHFLERMKTETGVERTFSDEMLRMMTEYDWPGNVRELENAIERACALSSGPVLHTGDMPTQLQDFRMQRRAGSGAENFAEVEEKEGETATKPKSGVVSIAELEKQAILDTIRQLNGDKLMAARLLGIGKTTLYRKLKEYGIEG